MIAATYFVLRNGDEHSYAVNRAGITRIEAIGTEDQPRLRIWAGDILLEDFGKADIVECGFTHKEGA